MTTPPAPVVAKNRGDANASPGDRSVAHNQRRRRRRYRRHQQVPELAGALQNQRRQRISQNGANAERRIQQPSRPGEALMCADDRQYHRTAAQLQPGRVEAPLGNQPPEQVPWRRHLSDQS